MILPPFYGYSIASKDRDPYRLYLSYLGKDIQTYKTPTLTATVTYLGIDAVTFSKFPNIAVITYVGQDVHTYKRSTKPLLITYLATDCLCFKYRPRVPGPPLNIYGTNGELSSVITWSEPVSTSVPVSDYIIEYSLANPYAIIAENTYPIYTQNNEFITIENSAPFNEIWTTTNDGTNNSTEYTIDNLSNTEIYIVRIKAVNQIGIGPYGYSNIIKPI